MVSAEVAEERAEAGGRGAELVIFVGVPASGKSTFFRARFATTHEHVSKDLWPHVRDRETRQRRAIDTGLRAGRSVVVDNINATAAGRAPLVELARRHGARVIGFYFESSARAAAERNRGRVGRERVPDVAIYVAARRLEPPRPSEGFDELYRVTLAPGGGFDVSAWPPAAS